MRSALLRRGATLVAVSTLSITVLGVTSTPANAHPAGDRATDAGAAWLKGELQDGLLLDSGYPAYGPSIDAGMAFQEVGDAEGVTIVDAALRAGINDYISGEAFGDTGSTYVNATAKAATFATIVDADPSAYGGVDLISRLTARVSATAPIAGRIEDASTFPGDYANVIGQSFAARALTVAASSRATEVTDFLLDQQCAEGFFRFGFAESKESSEQGCVTGAEGSEPDTDATAIAAINLLNTPSVSAAGQSAAASAVSWLKSQQAADGSLTDGDSEGVNANSTGLAGWAFAEAGDADAATRAAGWLRGVQIADIAPCTTTLTAENGALASKPQVLAATRTAGSIAPGQRITYAYATAQALPALANVSPGTGALSVSAPATAVEKSTVTVTVAGLGAGEAGCVSFGSVAKPVTGTGTNVPVTFELPAGAATNTFTLTTLAGSQTAVTTSTLAPVPTPLPTPEVGELTVKNNVTVKKNKFKLAVTCESTVACEGKVVVRTTKKVQVGSAKKARKVLVAKTAYSIEPGTTEKVVLKVRKPARKVLADGRIKVKAVQTAAGADTSVTKFRLRSK